VPDRPGLIVANPAASRMADASARARILRAAALAVEERTGTVPDVVVALDAEVLASAVRGARTAGAPLVVVIGGDGTLRIAARELEGSDVLLGIVPAGTGNLLSAALDISRSAERAARDLASAEPLRLDVGEILEPAGEHRFFLVACGLGFDAAVMAATTAEDKRRFGVLAYFATAARIATRLRAMTLRIRIDDTEIETRGLTALVANCGHLIPGLVAPRVPLDPTDGLLELLVVRAEGPVGGAVGAVELLARRDPHEAALAGGRSLRIRGRQIRITSEPPVAIQVDGDALPPSALEVVVRPGALHVLAPKRNRSGGAAH
jgi:diacylglycerol kinase (ATP)